MEQFSLYAHDSSGRKVPLGGVAVSGQTYFGLVFSGVITGSVDSWSQGANVTASAVTVGTSATTLAAANATRRALSIYNNHASNTLYIGPGTVATATGFPIPPGSNGTWNGAPCAAWSGIASGAGTDVRVLSELT